MTDHRSIPGGTQGYSYPRSTLIGMHMAHCWEDLGGHTEEEHEDVVRAAVDPDSQWFYQEPIPGWAK